MHINEYKPYREITDRLTEFRNQIEAIDSEIAELQHEDSVVFVPPGSYDDVNANEVMERLSQTAEEKIKKLAAQRQALKDRIPGMEQKQREAEREFARQFGKEKQAEFDAIRKKMAQGFVMIQQAIREQDKFERDVLAAGGGLGALDRRFNLLVDDAFRPSPFSAHQTEFYRDAINAGILTEKEVGPVLEDMIR